MSTAPRPLEAEELDRWIDGLESGEHAQYDGALRSVTPNVETGKHGYCCLGLKCLIDGLDLDQAFATYEDFDGSMKEEFIFEQSGTAWDADENPEPLQGLSYATRVALASANDSGQYTFAKIAAVLRRFREELLAGRAITWNASDDKWEVLPA